MHKVKFIEESHQYISDAGELTSVSAFTDRFKNKVDWNAIAFKVAKKKTREGEPTTAEEVLAKWERKRDIASSIGTSYHNFRENEALDTPNFYDIKCNVEFCPIIDNNKWSIPINELKNNTEYRELMIYDMEHMICGQADKVIVVNKKINIWDYKTDAKIDFKAFSSKWVDPAMMLKPLSHLEECNANIYSIKMSMYMYLLWKSNRGLLKPGDIILEHIHLKRDPNNDNLPILNQEGLPIVLKIEKIKLPYRKKEVMDMLATIKTK